MSTEPKEQPDGSPCTIGSLYHISQSFMQLKPICISQLRRQSSDPTAYLHARRMSGLRERSGSVSSATSSSSGSSSSSSPCGSPPGGVLPSGVREERRPPSPSDQFKHLFSPGKKSLLIYRKIILFLLLFRYAVQSVLPQFSQADWLLGYKCFHIKQAIIGSKQHVLFYLVQMKKAWVP